MIPNIISIIRILAVIPLSVSIYLHGVVSIWQPVVFVLILITDFIDGYIARRYNMVTNFGKILDPTVDKVLVILVTIMLIIRGIMPVYSLFIFIREIPILTLYAILYFKMDKKWAGADSIGKIKALTHFIALALILFLKKWQIYSLILLIISFLTVIPECILILKKYRNFFKKQVMS